MLVKVLVVSMVYGRASQHQRVRVGPAAAVDDGDGDLSSN